MVNKWMALLRDGFMVHADGKESSFQRTLQWLRFRLPRGRLLALKCLCAESKVSQTRVWTGLLHAKELQQSFGCGTLYIWSFSLQILYDLDSYTKFQGSWQTGPWSSAFSGTLTLVWEQAFFFFLNFLDQKWDSFDFTYSYRLYQLSWFMVCFM